MMRREAIRALASTAPVLAAVQALGAAKGDAAPEIGSQDYGQASLSRHFGSLFRFGPGSAEDSDFLSGKGVAVDPDVIDAAVPGALAAV